ncbi:DNA ligase [Paraburkholderia bengalensis]|uniref:DNA ligase n=1 Tax=Paraburkholderia bengalensis TaxID=2747562 RepID=A0ABU8J433_9BURK
MHATLRSRPFSDKDWCFEWKYDGFRCLVRKHSGQVDLISRTGKPYNRSFPDVVEAVSSLPGDFTWDTELAIGDGKGPTSFERLQQRARTTSAKSIGAAVRASPARLYVFDLLTVGDADIRELKLVDRRECLRDTFEDTATLVYSSAIVGVGAWVFEQVRHHCFEGMVAKRMTSPYSRGRSTDWIKIKNAGYDRPAALGFGR